MTEGIGCKVQSALKFVTFASTSVSFADGVPTPIGPSGHFPLIGGIGPLSLRGAFGASEILGCFKFRGKSPEKPKRFFWSVQGGPEGNRNPSGLVFFCQRFLLEKQKKMLKGSCKFPIRVLTLLCVSLTTKTVRIRRRTFNYRRCLLQPLRRCAPVPLVPKGNLCWILCQPYAPT